MVEEEVISLQPIGRGMLNLEPGTQTGTTGRATPSFPMNQQSMYQKQGAIFSPYLFDIENLFFSINQSVNGEGNQ